MNHLERLCLVGLGVLSAGCGASAPTAVATPSTAVIPTPTVTAGKTTRPTLTPTATAVRSAAPFPTEAFAHISEAPVSAARAAQFQAALTEMAGGGGMAATVMTADGTWSGQAGKADGVRDVRVDDQFAIASITKSVIAAQVMRMVEAGELALNDTAADHLPPDLDFNTNGATIRHLLGHRSGLPGYDAALFDPALQHSPLTDRQRVWTPVEVLALVPADRSPAGDAFHYANTNYLLLGLVIDQLRGQPLADVLRGGVLSGDGFERLIYQPDEVPTEPMAMPRGESTAAFEEGGGYLPSVAGVTADGPAAAMASDSLSLARWWRALCAGELVSEASLTEMRTFHEGYGFGLYSPYPGTVGHTGESDGYVAWAGCLPEDGSVAVVLTNRVVENVGAMAGPLVNAVLSP